MKFFILVFIIAFIGCSFFRIMESQVEFKRYLYFKGSDKKVSGKVFDSDVDSKGSYTTFENGIPNGHFITLYKNDHINEGINRPTFIQVDSLLGFNVCDTIILSCWSEGGGKIGNSNTDIYDISLIVDTSFFSIDTQSLSNSLEFYARKMVSKCYPNHVKSCTVSFVSDFSCSQINSIDIYIN